MTSIIEAAHNGTHMPDLTGDGTLITATGTMAQRGGILTKVPTEAGITKETEVAESLFPLFTGDFYVRRDRTH
jgi:hypothetical protein